MRPRPRTQMCSWRWGGGGGVCAAEAPTGLFRACSSSMQPGGHSLTSQMVGARKRTSRGALEEKCAARGRPGHALLPEDSPFQGNGRADAFIWPQQTQGTGKSAPSSAKRRAPRGQEGVHLPSRCATWDPGPWEPPSRTMWAEARPSSAPWLWHQKHLQVPGKGKAG